MTPLPRLIIALSAVLTLGSGTAIEVLGQATCVPFGRGLPPNNRPPNWWAPALPEYSTQLDDRRWEGMVSHTDGSTTAQHVDFRAIHRQDSLFLSWIVKVDQQLDPDPTGDQPFTDVLWFAIEQAGGKSPVLFRLSLGSQATGAAQNNYALKVWRTDQNGFIQPPALFSTGIPTAPTGPLPGWLSAATRIWIGSTAGEVWAFQTVIPTKGIDPNLGDGLDVATTFKMWYQFTVQLATGENPVYYTWPRGLTSFIAYDGAGGPGKAAWGDFAVVNAAPAPGTCLGDLTIEQHEYIGTTNPSSSLLIDVPKPPLPLPDNLDALRPRNTFFVRPTNYTSDMIPNGDITAKFWIANWGSQPSDWEFVPNPAANLWKQIPPPPPTIPAQPSNNLPVGLAPPANQIQLEWPMTVCEWFNFLDPAQYSDAALITWLGTHPGTTCPNDGTVLTERYRINIHLCVLTELEHSHGPPISFLRRSFWNNLDVDVHASRFTSDASISVQGVQAREGTRPKTVYLYVQTTNMPRLTSGPALPMRRLASAPRSTAPPDSTPRDPVFWELQQNAVTPTYWVHVYRETADSVVIRGAKRPALRAQSSFGYRVQHDGDLDGCKHDLEGEHLIQLTPNFYKLVVPNDSFATVTTTILTVGPLPWALGVHGGIAVPHGAFRNAVKTGFGVTGSLAHRLNRTFSVAALFGFHWFDSTGTSGQLDLQHISASLQMTVGAGAVRYLVDAGGGAYRFSNGPSDAGAHAGAGIELGLSPYIWLGAHYRGHRIFSAGSTTTFSAIQAGGRVRF